MKAKAKVRVILVSVIVILVFLPLIKPVYHQATNRELIESIERNALSANIKIVQLTHETGMNSSSIAVSAGASGVIIRKDGNRYFALTANHVIAALDDADSVQIIVLGYDDLDFKDSLNSGEAYVGIEDYYRQFPEAAVEYADEKSDLALICFTSDKAYSVLSLAENAVKYGGTVASMSNPYGKRNEVTAGTIGSQGFWDYEDKEGKFKYSIIKHSAFISAGSSGSALLNEDLEIVGINLGGKENLLHQFVSGMAITNDQIRAFLEEWRGNAFPVE